MKKNIILTTDSYKLTHWGMYPEGTEEVYSYFESRVGAKWPYTVFFGLQYLMKEYLEGPVVTREGIEEAANFCRLHFGDEKQFNRKGWEHILYQHAGHLPVEIKAVPEGTIVPTGNVLMTIKNTDYKCYWLTNHLETLLVQLWHACTVATSSTAQLALLTKAANISHSNKEILNLKLHDFGFRGSTSVEAAGLGGAAHLIPFIGTDNIAAISLINEYYNWDLDYMPGFSIPAAEHSTIIAHNDEFGAYDQILAKYPVVSIVSDSYDYENAINNLWGYKLHNAVCTRSNGLLVIRPDSGDPVSNVLWTLDALGKKFGVLINEHGFKSLPEGLAVIQGDGIDLDTLEDILARMTEEKWTTDSVAFGSGGGLLQKINRDTQRFAMKASSVLVNGEYRSVCKTPKTDMTKASKPGKMKLVRTESGYETVDVTIPLPDQMRTVFINGYMRRKINFEEVRYNWGQYFL